MIQNPILRGFNPDPSIVRVGTDFYIATSTFEWFPGVQIHHSHDLVHWRLLTRPLTRTRQLDLEGNPSSGGIWAPCLSFSDGQFWLVYTDVKTLTGAYKDTHNYVVTAPEIEGPWSDPVYLNSSGFDPSLFHDADGKKWLVNQLWDARKGRNRFGGIVLQEYSPSERRLVGPVRNIFRGTALGCTEGPHLYRRNGWYYLLTAEGGTGYHHAVTLARCRTLDGDYEVAPANPILTSRSDETLELQKAGHACLVDTPSGEWYMVHLLGRPLKSLKRCILGRETGIQKCRWTSDDWLTMEDGGAVPQVLVRAPDLPSHAFPAEPVREDFDASELPLQFQTLRVPAGEDWLSLRQRPGFLRLYGRESLLSWHRQSFVGRRVQAFRCSASTCLEFVPDTFQQMAGLAAFYNTLNWYYLHVSYDERQGRVLRLSWNDNGKYDESAQNDIPLGGNRRVCLRAHIDHHRLQFRYAVGDGVGPWENFGPELDASRLSDEYVGGGAFTGAFFGLCCQDLSGRRQPADFDWFEYVEEH